MSDIRQSPRTPRPQDDDDCKCAEKDNPTQKSINSERKKICDALYTSAGNTSKLEKRFEGENLVYEDKKCLFKKTEGNYQRFRNLEICVGTELLQTNESVKANVGAYNKLNKDLSSILKGIAKSIKDVKSKFADLKDAACKLESCTNDSCNTAQRKALTGSSPGCKGEPIEACVDAEKILTELICKPKGLAQDIDSVFKSSYDVVGIQVFSNIESLEPLQKSLEEQAKLFEKHIGDTLKSRELDMKKIQEDLVKSVQEITKAAMERNHERSNYEGYKDAADFVCCPDCECIDKCKKDKEDCGNDMKKMCDQLGKPSLNCCEDEICDICEDVQKSFCCKDEPTNKPVKQ
jgi:hypothetical protein